MATDYFAHHKKNYSDNQRLDEKKISKNPFEQFVKKLNEALKETSGEPNRMVLTTCNNQGQSSARIVLLKKHDQETFTFFTNYESRKSQDIKANPKVSCLFHWHELGLQILIEGLAKKSSSHLSQKYFATRPRQSQIAAWCSKQSHIIQSRETLLKDFQAYEEKFARKEIPCPSFWGGYDIYPSRFEFWQGRTNRLHDRIIYTKKEATTWEITRLAP
jgi:pyridoxamine 5'-phosphate oxidase